MKDLVNITNDFNDLSVQQSTPLQNVQSQTVPSHINLMTPDAFNNLKKEVPAQNINVDSADENKINNENSLKAFDGSVLEARVSSSPKMNQKLFDDLMYLGAKRLEEVEAPLATSECIYIFILINTFLCNATILVLYLFNFFCSF